MLKNIYDKLKTSINRDLVFTGINQFWKLISGPLTLLFIPIFLTADVQGYWFTFMSVSALAVFADLGFTNIVLQFAAHEFAHLHFLRNRTAAGSDIHLKRLASFFLFTIRWLCAMLVFVFPLILFAGFMLFSKKGGSNFWIVPWVMYLLGTAIGFFNNTLLAFFEGCGQVARVQRIRFEISVCNTIILLLMLYYGWGIYALSVSVLVSCTLICIYIMVQFGAFVKQLHEESKKFHYCWRKEFLQLFWKYALSFASGYFIFQIYTPLLFHFHGAASAGKIGISMALWLAAYSISNVWLYSVTPKINMFVSKKDWPSLDGLFKRAAGLSLATFIAGAFFFFAAYILVRGHFPFIDRLLVRFVSLPTLCCLAAAWFCQLFINALAVYLRAHKEEPLVAMSMVSAVYIAIVTFLCAKYLLPDYIFIGFLSSYLWMVPWVIRIFITKKKLWHV